jgi:hypothetical protein
VRVPAQVEAVTSRCSLGGRLRSALVTLLAGLATLLAVLCTAPTASAGTPPTPTPAASRAIAMVTGTTGSAATGAHNRLLPAQPGTVRAGAADLILGQGGPPPTPAVAGPVRSVWWSAATIGLPRALDDDQQATGLRPGSADGRAPPACPLVPTHPW